MDRERFIRSCCHKVLKPGLSVLHLKHTHKVLKCEYIHALCYPKAQSNMFMLFQKPAATTCNAGKLKNCNRVQDIFTMFTQTALLSPSLRIRILRSQHLNLYLTLVTTQSHIMSFFDWSFISFSAC